MNLSDLRTFLQIVEYGSLQRTAAARRVSRSVVRRQIDKLESDLGVTLLQRNVNGVTLTPAGSEVCGRAEEILASASALAESAKEASGDPRGVLRFIIPTGMPTAPRAHALLALGRLHPDLDVEVVEAEDPISQIGNSFDLMFHLGDAPALDGWFSQVLLRVPTQLLATPEYLSTHGTPMSVAELAQHRLLQWGAASESKQGLPLSRGRVLATKPWLQTANLSLLIDVAREDAGILYAPVFPEAFGTSHSFVPVLKGTVGKTIALRALSPRPSRLDPRIRAMLKNARRLIATTIAQD